MAKPVDEYVAALSGWPAEVVGALRLDILAAGGVAESFKWRHPVYDTGGPVCLIKAYKSQVHFGLWRGAEMKALDARMEEGGSSTMAYVKLQGPGEITADEAARLVAVGEALNREKGGPLKAGKS